MPLLPSPLIGNETTLVTPSTPRASRRVTVRPPHTPNRSVPPVPGWKAEVGSIISPPFPAFVFAAHTVLAFQAAQIVYHIPELLELIVVLCDWSTIMAVSRVNRYSRSISQAAIRLLVRSVLYPFIMRTDFHDFMAMLDASGAVVIGSVARRLLFSNSKLERRAVLEDDLRYLRSRDLNIVVPSGGMTMVRTWFVDHGYVGWTREAPQLPYVDVLRSFHTAHRCHAPGKPVSRIQIMDGGIEVF